jgi:hypothetical protein
MNAPKKVTVEQVIEEADRARERNIAQRLNAVMAEVEYVQKERPKQGMQYSYVSHDAVTKLVRPILQAHGVVYYPRDLHVTQNGNRTEAVFIVRFENIDDRSDYIDVATFGYGVDSQDKGPGKAMSYGVKYALLKALGLETGDDPEQDQGPEADHKSSTITEAQCKALFELINKAGVTNERFCKRFQIDFVGDLPADKFGEAKTALEAKIKEPA